MADRRQGGAVLIRGITASKAKATLSNKTAKLFEFLLLLEGQFRVLEGRLKVEQKAGRTHDDVDNDRADVEPRG